MSDERIPTTKRLADALRQANAPVQMIAKAEAGCYDDFKSESATPILDLVRDCRATGLNEIARAAIDEEFDAPAWESEQWAASPDGQMTLLEFFGTSTPQPRQGSARSVKFKQPKKH